MPIRDAGDAGHPGGGHPELSWTKTFQKGITIYAGRILVGCGLSDPAFGNGDSLPCEHVAPVPCLAQTAPAVFDGFRRDGLRQGLQNSVRLPASGKVEAIT
jgi:hypothetical protein